MVKRLPTMQEIQVQSLGQEDPLEKEMAIHSSVHAWKSPMDRGAWWATVQGLTKSRTLHFHIIICVYILYVHYTYANVYIYVYINMCMYMFVYVYIRVCLSVCICALLSLFSH